jgi:uncharacterized protein with HEPN domain
MSRSREALTRDVINATQLIDRYVSGFNQLGFDSRPQIQDAVSFRIMVIGEAAGDLLDYHAAVFDGWAIRDYQAKAFLKLFRRMRDKLIHHHWHIDSTVLFETARTDVPALHHAMLISTRM